jgi:hypothetical protein
MQYSLSFQRWILGCQVPRGWTCLKFWKQIANDVLRGVHIGGRLENFVKPKTKWSIETF